MCGITGIFNVNGQQVSINTLKKMTDVVKHRGPDGEGFWTNSFIGFGHRRLAILDLTEKGHQPMKTDDEECIIVYNGEVYNFQEIKKELQTMGYTFKSRTDTEVVLNSYKEWGKDCVLKFNGMFAFAIWDNKENTLFLARDRYGIIPLYYYYNNGVFIFGSEIKSILQHSDVSVSVSVPALNEYFSFQNIFSDLTLFDGIKILPAAHTILLKLGDVNSLQKNQYWDYHFVEDDTLTEKECVEELTRLFEQAVVRQHVSDVEIGSYLSGGMDSGSITCVTAKKFRNLKTFTCGFDLSSASGLEMGFDERQKAEFLSNLYKTEHYEVVLKAGDMERVMKDLIWHLEDPRVGQSYPNYYVSRLASKFVKVILSGGGGDELFGGYPWRYYKALNSESSEDYIDKYYRYWQRLIDDSMKPKFYHPDVYPQVWDYQCKNVFKKTLNAMESDNSKESYINRSLYLEIKTFLHGLLIVENKLSMAQSLETRVPFLDNDLVDFALRIPVKYKIKNLRDTLRVDENEPMDKQTIYFKQTNDGKNILRKVLKKYVPEEYTKSNKQGFSAPDASWFKGESIDYIRDLLFDKRARIYDYINSKTAQELMNEHFSGIKNRRLLIWSLLNFEWWLKTFRK